MNRPEDLDRKLSQIIYCTCDDVSVDKKYRDFFSKLFIKEKIPSICCLRTISEQKITIRYRFEFRLFTIYFALDNGDYTTLRKQQKPTMKELLKTINKETCRYGSGFLLNFCSINNNIIRINDSEFELNDEEMQKLYNFNKTYTDTVNSIISLINVEMKELRNILNIKIFDFIPFTSNYQDFDLLESSGIEINNLW